MIRLNKCSSGLLFENNFGDDVSLLWELSPNELNRIDTTHDSIRLLPGADRLELMIPCPKSSGWVLQTYINYVPKLASEAGGILLQSITDNLAECEIRGDTRETYSYLKAELSNDYIFNLRASKNGTWWRDFGNSKMFDGNKIGYYLVQNTSYNVLEIFNCIIYKSDLVTINDIPEECEIEIFDDFDMEITHYFNIKRESTRVVLDCINKLFPINYMKVKLISSTDEAEYFFENIYGGDIYSIANNLEFKINGTDVDDFFDLGVISGKDNIFVLTIRNCDNFDTIGRKLSVEYFATYNPGDNLVDIAEATSIDKIDNLIFEKELEINIPAYSISSFYIRIERDEDVSLIGEDYKFKIVVK